MDKTVGERLKEARQAKGLSQGKLSRLADVASSYINRIENGKRKGMGIEIAHRLAQELGVDVNYFAEDHYIPAGVIEVPVLGTVPADNISLEDKGEVAIVPKEELATVVEGLFALKVVGDGLASDGITDGEIVVVEPTTELIDGRIYVAKQGDSVVAGHIYKDNGSSKLIVINGKHKIIDVNQVEILGQVVLSGRWRRHR